MCTYRYIGSLPCSHHQPSKAIKPHVAALDAAVAQSKELLEGNILYMHQSLKLEQDNFQQSDTT